MEKTKHKHDCKKAFAHKDPTCPRCIELINGAAPRKAWFTARPVEPRAHHYCAHDTNASGYCNSCGSGRDYS